KAVLLSLALVMFAGHLLAAGETIVPSSDFGGHRETVEDLRVKVQGGYIRHTRSWNRSRWYFNRRWETLREVVKSSTIHRGAAKYKLVSGGVYAHESWPGQTIVKSATGYRWQNRKGDWVNYDTNRRAINYGDKNNVGASFAYDTQDRLTGVFDHNGQKVLWYEYNLDGNLSLVKDYSDRKVEYKYANSVQIEEVIDPRGNSSSYAYPSLQASIQSGSSRLNSKTDTRGNETTLSYNGSNLVDEINTAGVSVKYSAYYDKTKAEFYRREVYSTGKEIEKWYGKTGDLIRKAVNGIVKKRIEISGNTHTVIDENGRKTIKRYNQWRNLVRETYDDGNSISIEYDGNLSNRTKYTDENGVITKYDYDTNGNRIRMTEALGLAEQRISEYTHDAYGNQTQIKTLADAQSAETIIDTTYDSYGNMASYTDAEGHVTEYLAHDVLGNAL
ncbi:MAG: hypothetical protein GY821_00815, partial [Gammaproteobacteria bacterium]|nr:hypothetical protein [Gammaproteobacteria bacterium]